MIRPACALLFGALFVGQYASASGLFALDAAMPGDLTGAIETLTDSNAKSCFRNALEILHGTCSRLGESHKRVLALR
jgi:hypothetical protein